MLARTGWPAGEPTGVTGKFGGETATDRSVTAISSASREIASRNPARKVLMITNNGAEAVHITFGYTPTTATGLRLNGYGGYLEVPGFIWLGDVRVISESIGVSVTAIEVSYA